MKKQISILGFLLLSSIAQAQITIQTTVKGYGNRVGIGYWKNLTYNEDTLQLNMNKASFKLDSSIPIYFKFRTIDPDTYTPFFMAFPGDIIAIEKDSDHFTIKGGAESYNRFLIKTDSEMRAAFTGKRLDYNATTKYLLDRSEEFFSSFNYPNKQMLKDLYTLSVITNYKLYPIISKYNNDTSKMNGLFQLLRNQKRSSNDDDILKYIDQVNFNNPNMGYASMSDIIMMNNFIMILRTQAIKKDSTLRDIDEYIIDNRLIKDLFKESRYRSRLLAYNLYSRIESYTQYPMLLAQVNDFIDDFRKEEFSSELTPPIEKLYASQLSTIGALAKGAIAPAFKLPDTKGKLVSLSDFKGKVVYLDLWASWCGPCLHEMPYMEKLKKTFNNKPVEFIAISIDTDPDKWMTKVLALKLTGMQLIDSKGSEKSKIAKDYKIYGVPHYILIDKNGLIASANAPRPSSVGEIEKAINQLL